MKHNFRQVRKQIRKSEKKGLFPFSFIPYDENISTMSVTEGDSDVVTTESPRVQQTSDDEEENLHPTKHERQEAIEGIRQQAGRMLALTQNHSVQLMC